MHKITNPVLVAGICLSLGACSGGNGTVNEVTPEPVIPPSHAIQTATISGPPVSTTRDENGDLTAIEVGTTEILPSQRIDRVSGGGTRGVVGIVLENNGIIVRHVTAHWNTQTDVVTDFDYISFGAWATGMPEPRMGGGWDYNYQSIGDAYLTALDGARTSAAEMPVTGAATYLGQFTGFFQGHGVDGAVNHATGDVTMTADFANATMVVDTLSTRNNRLVLSGTIHGDEFRGTTIDHIFESSLLQTQDATAQFRGGFYGDEATEAGGIFEVVGGRAQDPGRLVGAFGGRKEE